MGIHKIEENSEEHLNFSQSGYSEENEEESFKKN
jgi:hypothetical protein